MRMRRFRRLLDSRGATLEAWPPAERDAARALIAAHPAAVASLAEARRLEALLGRVVVAEPEGAETRILAALTHLAQQRRPLSWWPAVLSRWDFTPSWSRVMTLATVTALGMVIGLSDIEWLSGDLVPADLSILVLDEGPGVGLDAGLGQ